MIAVGLTGGIGSGKSTVAAMLVGRGAELVDADVIAREVLEPGLPAFDAVVEAFGKGILADDGRLDRAALARLVFSDPAARTRLNDIVHPEVGTLILERLAELSQREGVAVLDVPLLAEGARDRYPVAGVLVVDCPVDIALARLVTLRGMAREDAEARIAAQATREERLRVADFIIMNMGTLEELSEMVGRAWEWIATLGGEGAPA